MNREVPRKMQRGNILSSLYQWWKCRVGDARKDIPMLGINKKQHGSPLVREVPPLCLPQYNGITSRS